MRKFSSQLRAVTSCLTSSLTLWLIATSAVAVNLAACSTANKSANQKASAGPVSLGGKPTPPVAKQVPHTVESPFGNRQDEYYWLRDDDANKKRPEVMEYLGAEAAYTQMMMAPLKPLQERLVSEMRARIKEDDTSVPAYNRGWWYWQQFDVGAEYPTYVRRAGTASGQNEASGVEVLLDVPALAKSEDFLKIGDVAVSPDNQWLAWTQDVSGRRIHSLRIKNLQTGETLADQIDGTLESVEWAADSKTLFYVRQDPVLLQSGPVYRHTRGTPAAADVLVYDEPDKTMFTEIDASRSRKYLLISIEGYDTNELRAVSLDAPESPAVVIFARRPDVRNYANHCAGRWLVRTNDGARNFKLCLAPEIAPSERTRWVTIMPERKDASIDDATAFDSGIAVAERVEANPRVRIIPWNGGDGKVIPATESAFAMSLGENLDPANISVRITYTSMVTPRTTIDVDLASGSQAIRKVQPVLGYDAKLYETSRVWAPSRDGKRIPVSLSWRKDAFQKNGTHPVRIEGYGAYGIPSDAEFDMPAINLMDRGFLIATAHVRGGADLGQGWYEDGRLSRKKNSFTDFIDATDFLAKDGWCDPARRFATGGSAGGLLMGAVVNMAGERYRGVALHVPFVDVMTTMLDETIPLTTNEWTQWGNPAKSKAAYEYMLSYSPYDNLSAKAYPAMLVTTGLWDSQVQYYEPAKFVARLRRLRTDAHPFYMHINMEAGHGGKSGRFARLEQVAMEQAFFLDLAGVKR